MRSRIARADLDLFVRRGVVTYHRVFVDLTGSVVAALFLSNLWFFKDKGADPNGWIYKRRWEIEQETGLTRRQQETARRKLTGSGILVEELRDAPAKLYYRIDCDRVTELLQEHAEPTAQGRSHETRHQEGAKPPNKRARNDPTFLTSLTTSVTTSREDSGGAPPLAPQKTPEWWDVLASIEVNTRRREQGVRKDDLASLLEFQTNRSLSDDFMYETALSLASKWPGKSTNVRLTFERWCRMGPRTTNPKGNGQSSRTSGYRPASDPQSAGAFAQENWS